MSYIKERQLSLDDLSGMNRKRFVPLESIPGTPWYDGNVPDEMEIDDWFTPKAVQELLDVNIIGQEAAKRAASMIIYSTYEYAPSTTLFIGPTGCGKTEIWRCLAQEWKGMIHIADASTITAEGWKGSAHISTLMQGADVNRAWKKHILVLDEWDKIFDQRNSEVDYYDLIQDQMLKLFDHDDYEFSNSSGLHSATS